MNESGMFAGGGLLLKIQMTCVGHCVSKPPVMEIYEDNQMYILGYKIDSYMYTKVFNFV